MSWFFTQKFGMELEKEVNRWKEITKTIENINEMLRKTLDDFRK